MTTVARVEVWERAQWPEEALEWRGRYRSQALRVLWSGQCVSITTVPRLPCTPSTWRTLRRAPASPEKVGGFTSAELSGMSGEISECSFVLPVFGNSPGSMNYSCGFSKSHWSQRCTSVTPWEINCVSLSQTDCRKQTWGGIACCYGKGLRIISRELLRGNKTTWNWKQLATSRLPASSCLLLHSWLIKLQMYDKTIGM